MKHTENTFDRIYNTLREMASNFEFKPDERINEVAMAAQVNASRTPVREALNRLVAEGFLTFQPGRGFFCRSLSPDKILDLYEARVALECEAVRLACKKATNGEISDFSRYLDAIEPQYTHCADPSALLVLDEDFHMRIVQLAKNDELKRLMVNLNDRIRYIRTIDHKTMSDADPGHANRAHSMIAHRTVFEAIEIRDSAAAVHAMRTHIERRLAEATHAVQVAFSQLYVPT